MRDPVRIKRITDLLSEVWAKVPDWRLTQLVINASDTKHNCGPVFHLEDNEFERRLRKLAESLESQSLQLPEAPQ
jgi:hypothetical protein